MTRTIQLPDPLQMSPVRSVLQDARPVVYEVTALCFFRGAVEAVATICPWEVPVRDRVLRARLGREALRVLGFRLPRAA